MNASDAILGQRAAHTQDRFGAVLAPYHQLGQQRIVEQALQPHARPGRLGKAGDTTGLRQEVVIRIFGVDAALDSVPFEMNLLLTPTQPPARRDGQLLLDDVHAGDHFRDRMFDLQTGIHLQKIEVARPIEQKLDGAGVGITNRARRAHGHFAHSRAQLRRHRYRRRLLD